MANNINVSIVGLDAVIRRLDQAAKQQFKDNINRRVETVARTMANEAAGNAPVDSGKLRNSLTASVEKTGEMQWQFGSDLEYAAKQEYEHKTHKAFVRKAVWNNENKLKVGVQEEIRRL